jgi:uncharacterized membrane protein
MTRSFQLGHRLAPARFVTFLVILIVAAPALQTVLGWRHGAMAGFDIAAVVFLASLSKLFESKAADMRRHAERNDANRTLMLAISAVVMLVILVAVGSELIEKGSPKAPAVTLIVSTLALAWFFANTVYALHYAHLFYTQGDPDGDGKREDLAGLDFPKTKEPNYWDFLYFSFTLGMTFQTSDVEMTTSRMRVVAIFQCLAAFVFNLGVLAFTINVLGGG